MGVGILVRASGSWHLTEKCKISQSDPPKPLSQLLRLTVPKLSHGRLKSSLSDILSRFPLMKRFGFGRDTHIFVKGRDPKSKLEFGPVVTHSFLPAVHRTPVIDPRVSYS